MVNGNAIDQVVQRRQDTFVKELAEFCAQPSISTQNQGIAEMVQIVKTALERRGFQVRVIETKRHPAIIAEYKGRSSKSVLFYNHYDVQPPEPYDQWITPPFQPDIRDGKFYARGVMDDKGHLMCRLAAVDAVKEVYGELPCTVKFIIEGEEEISSPNLEQVITDNQDALQSDLCVWEFGEVDSEGISQNYLGFRGMLYVELSVKTAETDCHSGVWGTLLPNAAWRLNWAMSRLKDAKEKILIPGFYDRVVPPSARDMELMNRLPVISDADRPDKGMQSYIYTSTTPAEFYRNAVFTPSCTICGLTAGYQGEGPKTIIPAKAAAKVDFRLVPDQTPDEIFEKLRKYLDAEGYDDIKVSVLGKINPSRTPVDHPLVQMAAACAREVYGQPQRIFPLSGGSGPGYFFTQVLHTPIITAGVGYLGSNIHAPNENIRLDDFYKGIRHTARILANMGETESDPVE
jgi:acetylornithine deacetylase/succinyl-diaminopimelate desuccinylase-like protein